MAILTISITHYIDVLTQLTLYSFGRDQRPVDTLCSSTATTIKSVLAHCKIRKLEGFVDAVHLLLNTLVYRENFNLEGRNYNVLL